MIFFFVAVFSLMSIMSLFEKTPAELYIMNKFNAILAVIHFISMMINFLIIAEYFLYREKGQYDFSDDWPLIGTINKLSSPIAGKTNDIKNLLFK